MATLLYIDSDTATRQLVARVLAPAGVRVVEAATVKQGAGVSAETRPGVVLVDIDVAGMPVDEVVPQFRHAGNGQAPIVLAATADDRPQHLAQCATSGFTAVLLKPLDIDALPGQVSRHFPDLRAETAEPGAELPLPASATSTRLLWRRSLTPLTVNLVKNVATSEGVLALRDEARDELVIVAAHSLRPGASLPPLGATLSLAEAAWLEPALTRGEPVLVQPDQLASSPLLPAHCSVALVVPITDGSRTYGVVVLGERRKRTFGFPPAQVAQSRAEAARLAAVIREFEQLDEAIRTRRREIDEMRIVAACAIAPAGPGDAARENGVRLGARVAERLDLPLEQRPVLEQALRVHDVGRVWLARSVLPVCMLTAADSQTLLDGHAEQTLEILASLDCPPQVCELVSASAGPWKQDESGTSLAARILAVVAAYQTLTRRGEPNRKSLRPEEAVAELLAESGARYDPTVVEALADLILEKPRPT